jgi:biopolymer transport protein TolQ
MAHIFMGNALWQLIKQSDAVSKGVMLLLLCMSILCWAVFIYKLILLRNKSRHLDHAITAFKSIETFDHLLDVASKSTGTIQGYFISRNLAYLKGMLEGRVQGGITILTQAQWNVLQQNMYNTFDDIMRYEESYVSILSTSAAVSPLLGLFGTVWGLVHAFVGISQKQSADIATVAPGIAEALMTTLAGLMVAIPALIMLSLVNTRLQTIEQKLLTIHDRSVVILQRLFVH